MSFTVLSIAYALAPVGPHAVGGSEQILSALDAGMTARGARLLVVACRGSRAAGTLIDTDADPTLQVDTAVREAARQDEPQPRRPRRRLDRHPGHQRHRGRVARLGPPPAHRALDHARRAGGVLADPRVAELLQDAAASPRQSRHTHARSSDSTCRPA